MLAMEGEKSCHQVSSRKDIPHCFIPASSLVQGFNMISDLDRTGPPTETDADREDGEREEDQSLVAHIFPKKKTLLEDSRNVLTISTDSVGTSSAVVGLDLNMSSPTTSGGSGKCQNGSVHVVKTGTSGFPVSPGGATQPGGERTTTKPVDTSVSSPVSTTTPRHKQDASRSPSTTARCHLQQRPITQGEKTPKVNHNVHIPWKKRPLKTSGTNFHSIADLVTPSSKREDAPAHVTSQAHTMHPENRHRLSPSPAPGSMTSSRHVTVTSDQPHGSRLKAEPRNPSFGVGVFEDDIDVVAPDCSSAVLDNPLRHSGLPDLSHSTNDPQPPSSSSARSSPSPLSSSLSPGAMGHDSSRVSPPAPGATDPETADPNRLRKGRTIYKAQQVYVLEQVFSRTHYPDPEVIETLSRELDISENKIKVWFQNKRARWRRRAAETGLPPQPIGFTLSGTPGLPTSWAHPTSLPSGVLMPQPIYTSPYGGPQVAPRPAFPHMGHLTSLGSSPLYLGFNSNLMHHAPKGISGPAAILPYSNYPMSVIPAPTHVWGDAPKLPGT